MKRGAGRRFFAPEVVQTSAMDCGPASLKCLLEGFGVPVSYGRLREACQTEVDGTSIDTLEEIACSLGLQAEQVMVPVDHVLLPESQLLPALAVVRLPNGFTHFVVIWRRHGPIVQIMDPASGRRFAPVAALLGDLYVHRHVVPAAAFQEWADSPEFRAALLMRLAAIGAGTSIRDLLDASAGVPGARGPAALDAAVRMVDSMVRGGALRRGADAERLLVALHADACRPGAESLQAVPEIYWTALPAQPAEDGTEQLFVRGAVLVAIRSARLIGKGAPSEVPAPALSPELKAALAEPERPPWRELWKMIRADGLLSPASLVSALALATAGAVFEVILLRGLFDLGIELGLLPQRLAAIGIVTLLMAVMLVVEMPVVAEARRIGRRLEGRLRVAFLEKIPRLPDRYFHSRPTSDMAARSHSVHLVRQLPDAAAQALRAAFEVVLTTIGIAWLDPQSALSAAIVALTAVAVPILVQRPLVERDLRKRVHSGALGRFYLDALLGLIPIRTHGAERAVRREHESLLSEWARAARAQHNAVLLVDGAQGLLGFALAAALLHGYVARGGTGGGALLLVYWALGLPALGQEIALQLRQYPVHRNVTLRLMEPLGAIEEPEAVAPAPAAAAREGGAAIEYEGVTVLASGHTILESVSLSIASGSHVAVVGLSGAGKTTLVGLLLGWHRPASGRLCVDGIDLSGGALDALRRQTAWVDPAIQLWNRTLLENLLYGSGDGSASLRSVIEDAELHGLLEELPSGLQTVLGEGGGLVSGGEGQRVRLGRAFLRRQARLAILDEPFRGIERKRRHELLSRARRLWSRATLLCITHDVRETLSFPRVLVIDRGRVVEDGDPSVLRDRAGSRYRAMLDAEEGLWGDVPWRAYRMADGRLSPWSAIEGAVVPLPEGRA